MNYQYKIIKNELFEPYLNLFLEKGYPSDLIPWFCAKYKLSIEEFIIQLRLRSREIYEELNEHKKKTAELVEEVEKREVKKYIETQVSRDGMTSHHVFSEKEEKVLCEEKREYSALRDIFCFWEEVSLFNRKMGIRPSEKLKFKNVWIR